MFRVGGWVVLAQDAIASRVRAPARLKGFLLGQGVMGCRQGLKELAKHYPDLSAPGYRSTQES